MPALTRQLALLSESKRVRMGDLMKVAAALQKQAVRDLAPIWDISATVDAEPGAAGYHTDRDGQPFALISATDALNGYLGV